MNPTQAAPRISAAMAPPQKQNKTPPAQAAATQQTGTRKGQPVQDQAASADAEDAIAPQSENGAEDDVLDLESHPLEGQGDQDTESDPLAPNDEGEQAGEAEEDQATHTVKVDGKEVQVSTAELIKGYNRQADYTKKSTALAHERKQVEALKEEVKDLPQVKKAYQDSTQEFARNSGLVLKALQDRFLPKAPNPDLAEKNPGLYIKQKELHQEALQFVGGIQQELGKIQQLQAAEFNKQKAESRGKLVTLIPEIADVAHRTKFTSYLTGLGFTNDDITNTVDNRLFQMAHKAWKYDEMVKAKAGIQTDNPKPKVSKSSVAPEDPKAVKTRQQREPFDRHKRERSVESAAMAMRGLL